MLSEISVLVLTKNEQDDLPECLNSVRWCEDVTVFDSYSEDRTVEIAKEAGAKVVQRRFDNWASHQNWGLANIPFRNDWVLYIDADERVDESLREWIRDTSLRDASEVAFEVQRRDFAWNGVWLRHAQISPYFLRLFRPCNMRYERLVNPLSIPSGPVGRARGFLDHYPFSKGFRFWWQRHLGYADLEAETQLRDIGAKAQFSIRKALVSKDFTERRFHQKGLFYRIPGRYLIKWLYVVLWRRAFLDGGTGLTYATMQSIYEYFIVLRVRELLARKVEGQDVSI